MSIFKDLSKNNKWKFEFDSVEDLVAYTKTKESPSNANVSSSNYEKKSWYGSKSIEESYELFERGERRRAPKKKKKKN